MRAQMQGGEERASKRARTSATDSAFAASLAGLAILWVFVKGLWHCCAAKERRKEREERVELNYTELRELSASAQVQPATKRRPPPKFNARRRIAKVDRAYIDSGLPILSYSPTNDELLRATPKEWYAEMYRVRLMTCAADKAETCCHVLSDAEKERKKIATTADEPRTLIGTLQASAEATTTPALTQTRPRSFSAPVVRLDV